LRKASKLAALACGGYCLQHTNAPGQLLRSRRERPRRRRAAERSQQFPQFHGLANSGVPSRKNILCCRAAARRKSAFPYQSVDKSQMG
jgi:hypothetical protein